MLQKMLVFFWCAFLCGTLFSALSETTQPSETKFVQNEIARGSNLLANNDIGKILDDPYLASAMYYSNSFFSNIRRRTNMRDQDKVIIDLAPLITSTARERYIAELRAFPENAPTRNLVLPVDRYKKISRNCRSCHPDAVDLFTEEGSTVRSMSSGIVVLAEGGWQPDQPLTASSPRGGNEIIIFDPTTNRFYRYCHLGSISVSVRNIVRPGQTIGTVGHTGINASLPKHGQHLHLEINQYDRKTGTNRSIPRRELVRELGQIRKK